MSQGGRSLPCLLLPIASTSNDRVPPSPARRRSERRQRGPQGANQRLHCTWIAQLGQGLGGSAANVVSTVPQGAEQRLDGTWITQLPEGLGGPFAFSRAATAQRCYQWINSALAAELNNG